MKRSAFFFGMLVVLAQLAGCGSDAPPPADGSNLPDEVREYEARIEAERAKQAKPKAAKPGPR